MILQDESRAKHVYNQPSSGGLAHAQPADDVDSSGGEGDDEGEDNNASSPSSLVSEEDVGSIQVSAEDIASAATPTLIPRLNDADDDDEKGDNSNSQQVEVVLSIQGMMCNNYCTPTVTKALTGLPGVTAATVTLEPGEAKVTYDGQAATLDDMKRVVSR